MFLSKNISTVKPAEFAQDEIGGDFRSQTTVTVSEKGKFTFRCLCVDGLST